MEQRLPVEIWLRVLFYCQDPKPLSQTQKKLHNLCLNPLSTSRWLSYQFGQQSMYAALFFWAGRSDIYRYWILQFRPNLKLPKTRKSKSKRALKKLKRIAISTYSQNWFHVGRKAICSRCLASGSHNFAKFDKNYVDQSTLEDQIHKHIISGYCSFERYQLAICKQLIRDLAEIRELLPLLVRYAASVGHIQLLQYFISLCSGLGSANTVDTSLDDTVNTSSVRTLEILPVFRPCITKLLFNAVKKGKIVVVSVCLKTNIVHTFNEGIFTELITELLSICSVSITSLIIAAKPKSIGFVHFSSSVRLSAFSIYGKKTKRSYEAISMMLAKEIPSNIVAEEEPLIASLTSEFGRIDLIRYFYKKRNLNFNPGNNLPLFQAALFGYPDAVKVLLNECNVNPSIFHSGRVSLFAMLLVDYMLIILCLFNAELSVLNELGCRLFRNQGPTLTMFYVSSTSSLCVADTKYDTPFASILLLLFFLAAYYVLSMFTSLSGLIKSLVIIRSRIRRSKKVGMSSAGLENQNSVQTLSA